MTSHRAYRKPIKHELSEQSDAARKAKMYAFKAHAARDFKRDGVVRRAFGKYGWSSAITKSARVPGWFQVTRFNAEMEPVGHTERGTLKEALDALYWDVVPKATRVPLHKGLTKPTRVVRIGSRTFKV